MSIVSSPGAAWQILYGNKKPKKKIDIIGDFIKTKKKRKNESIIYKP